MIDVGARCRGRARVTAPRAQPSQLPAVRAAAPSRASATRPGRPRAAGLRRRRAPRARAPPGLRRPPARAPIRRACRARSDRARRTGCASVAARSARGWTPMPARRDRSFAAARRTARTRTRPNSTHVELHHAATAPRARDTSAPPRAHARLRRRARADATASPPVAARRAPRARACRASAPLGHPHEHVLDERADDRACSR